MTTSRASADARLQRLWYESRPRWALWMLAPFSLLFWALAAVRRGAYRLGLLRSIRVSRPVIVIGNITVGGVGKTPLTIWLANQLQARGARVAIILRGYGGRARNWPQEVTASSLPEDVGDEAVLIASRCEALVVAGPDRVADAKRAIALGADIILSDDGLQHYRLARDLEIAVLDAARGVGNGWLLPAGPLREPPRRLAQVDLVIATERDGSVAREGDALTATMRLGRACNIATGERLPLTEFGGRRVHAVAGIGNPQAFFDALAAGGLVVDARPLADHAELAPADLQFGDSDPVLMTEKDAVKCRAFADARCWSVRLELELSEAAQTELWRLIERVSPPGESIS